MSIEEPKPPGRLRRLIDAWNGPARDKVKKVARMPAVHHGHNALAFCATAFEIHEGSLFKALIGVCWCGFALIAWANGEDLL